MKTGKKLYLELQWQFQYLIQNNQGIISRMGFGSLVQINEYENEDINSNLYILNEAELTRGNISFLNF